jgi:hypothetical protein
MTELYDMAMARLSGSFDDALADEVAKAVSSLEGAELARADRVPRERVRRRVASALGPTSDDDDTLRKAIDDAFDAVAPHMRKKMAWNPTEYIKTMLTRPCEVCLGLGLVCNKEWEDFEQRCLDEASLTGRNLGEVWQDHIGEQPDVPEEEVCPRCNGSGKQLTELGKKMAAMLSELE